MTDREQRAHAAAQHGQAELEGVVEPREASWWRGVALDLARDSLDGLARERQLEAELAAAKRVVEAAAELPVGHSWRCEFRVAAMGWKPGNPPLIRCECGLDEYEAALDALAAVGTQEGATQ